MLADMNPERFRHSVRNLASALRAYAMEADSSCSWPAGALQLPIAGVISRLGVPSRYGGGLTDPETGAVLRDLTFQEIAVVMEEMAWGDAPLTMGQPGPNMTLGLIRELASEEQQRLFYGTFTNGQPAWAAFALSEPGVGSDAARITTSARRDGSGCFVLNGEKYFVGSGDRASWIVVFANLDPGGSPLGIQACLVPGDAPGIERRLLPTLGMRAVRLTHLIFRDCRIPEAYLLGRHLSAARRGLWGAMSTFNQIRPMVAAIGLGIARAAFDYAREHLPHQDSRQRAELAAIDCEIHAVRALIQRAAAQCDQGRADAALSAMAKVKASRLAEEATRKAARLLGPGSLVYHPLLEKWTRDARAIEFMEGTSHIQKRSIARALGLG